MLACGDNLVCAHTDGLWAIRGAKLHSEWRVKATAQRVELLTPQKLRYHPRSQSPVTVYSGVPLEQGAAAFDRDWSRFNERHVRGANDPEGMPMVPGEVRVTQGGEVGWLPEVLPDPV
jgi:hypothetical protein